MAGSGSIPRRAAERRYAARPSRQRGVALLLVLLAIVLATGYVGMRGLNAAYAKPERDARTLATMHQAKQALLGYAANRVRLLGLTQWAAAGAKDVPGALPCPMATLDYLQSLPTPAPQEYGRARESCTTPAVRIGRLPWRTLEIPEPTDGSGEGLWYAVSSSFRFQTTATPSVNLNSQGRIRLQADGVVTSSRIVAVIIAPGAVLAGQQRGSAAERDDVVNYLERYTLAPIVGIDFDFYAGRPTNDAPAAFNDLIVTITEAELFDAIENSIARRLEESVLPKFAVHRGFWGTLPYATGYFDPQQTLPGLAGTAGSLFGHLPVAHQVTQYTSATQTSGSATVNCTGPLLAPLPAASLECQISGASGETFTIDAVVTNTGAAFFGPVAVDTGGGATITSVNAAPIGATLDSTVRIQGIQGTATSFTVSAPPQLLDESVPPTNDVEWFDFSEWARFVYYVRCADSSTACITVTQTSAPPETARAVLVLAGRPVMKSNSSAQSRPSSFAADYLEAPHDTLPTLAFQRGIRTTKFNDRVVALP